MASLKKHERLKRKAIILLEDCYSAEISERAIIQELLDSGASKPEADRVVEDLFEAGKVRRSTMGYLKISIG